MEQFRALAELALGPSVVKTDAAGMILTAPEAVFLASEFVRVQSDLRDQLPKGSILLSKFHTQEEDRYNNTLVEGVTLYILFPKS